MLIMRDHKGKPLAQLSFTGGHFEGQDTAAAPSRCRISNKRYAGNTWPNISFIASRNRATPTAPP